MTKHLISYLVALLSACTTFAQGPISTNTKIISAETQSSINTTSNDNDSPEMPLPDTNPGDIETLSDGGVRLSTKDGLWLTLDSAGRVTSLTLNQESLPINTDQLSGKTVSIAKIQSRAFIFSGWMPQGHPCTKTRKSWPHCTGMRRIGTRSLVRLARLQMLPACR